MSKFYFTLNDGIDFVKKFDFDEYLSRMRKEKQN